MTQFPTILVAAALDERDAATLRHAAWFAQQGHASAVDVAHVAPAFDVPETAAGEQAAQLAAIDDELRRHLEATVGAQPALFPAATQVRCIVRRGSLVPELVRLAAQQSADLLCLGRRTGHEHDLLSESAVGLVRKAPCSVCLVPAGAEPRYERILVPVDFSDHARDALNAALGIAESAPGASVTVQHVSSVPPGYSKAGRSYEEFASSLQEHARRHWDQFAATVDFRGVAWNVRFDRGESLPRAVLDAARDIDADLLVLGSHGRTRSAGLLLGHAADAVCAKADRPVLCVKRKGEVVNLLQALLQLFEFKGE